MRPSMQMLGVAGLLILAGFFSCGQQTGRPHAGDTLRPQLEWPVQWTAGEPGGLGIRLYAKGRDDRGWRLLDFSAIPLNVNPIANITFYAGDQPLDSVAVALSHRC